MRVVTLVDTDGKETRLYCRNEDVAWEMNRYFSLQQDIVSVDGDVVSEVGLIGATRKKEETDRASAYLYRFHMQRAHEAWMERAPATIEVLRTEARKGDDNE